MPIGIGNIGWKMYMINGAWDIITLVLIVSVQSLLTFPSFIKKGKEKVIYMYYKANIDRLYSGSRPRARV
jgi:hypothetical protein